MEDKLELLTFLLEQGALVEPADGSKSILLRARS